MEKKYLDFERPIQELDKKIAALLESRKNGVRDAGGELVSLRQKLTETTRKIFSELTDWQVVQLARHPNRPHALDYIGSIFEDFVELHGDRCTGDDPAIVAGMARFRGIPVAIVGQQKGRDVKENLHRKFGMAHPEGYRKALRVMKLAEKLQCPVVTLIDTPGANPDMQAEERGQALSIANNLMEMSMLRTPMLCIVTGEGGSGGALGIGVGDRIVMQSYSVYSVISPEGCASILWKSQEAVEEAARALKLTARALLELGVIDEVISEPPGGAHRDWAAAFENVAGVIEKNIRELKTINIEELVELRYMKYRKIGVFTEKQEEKDE